MRVMDRTSYGALALLVAIGGPAGAAPAAAADPAAVAAPVFKAGDAWVFEETTEQGQTSFTSGRADLVIERVDGDTMLVGAKKDGAPTGYQDQVRGTDWSHRLVVNGQETISNRPFAFPMSIGQSWTSDWTDPTRRGTLLSGHVHTSCTPKGWEDVTVPAGTFHALKVVCKGVEEMQLEVPAQAAAGTITAGGGATSVAHVQKGGRGSVTHVTYREAWYAPEIKTSVKNLYESYNTDNVRLRRETEALVSFKPAT